MSRLRHPHIVRVLETFEANGTAYYAMEYCEGGCLNELADKRGGLPEEEAVGYAVQIGEALAYMHAHKMLHLDVKPGNAMLRGDGSVALIDFGLSKQYDENGVPESSTSVGGGTPGYAPLEQAQYREGRDFPVTMDVYALGATLFKLLTGERPPEASAVLNDGFPAGALRRRKVSEATIAIAEKAMSPLRKDRYPSVNAMLAALKGGAAPDDEETDLDEKKKPKEKEPDEEPPVIKEPERKKPGRRKALAWAGAGVAAALLIAALLAWNQNRREEAAAQQLAQERLRHAADSLRELARQDSLRLAEEARIANKQRRQDSIQQAEKARRTREEAERRKRESDKGYQFERGLQYYNKRNYTEAVKWWRKSAEQGHASAQNNLGECYYYGQGVAQDYAKAAKWYRKAAEQGRASAQYNLGWCYYNGRGVAQDYAEAVKWYRKAAEQGHAAAQYNLGWCYDKGKGVAQNQSEAIKWYRKAADQGDTDAKEALERLGR